MYKFGTFLKKWYMVRSDKIIQSGTYHKMVHNAKWCMIKCYIMHSGTMVQSGTCIQSGAWHKAVNWVHVNTSYCKQVVFMIYGKFSMSFIWEWARFENEPNWGRFWVWARVDDLIWGK